MTKIIMCSVVGGILVGLLLIPESMLNYTGYLIDGGLVLLLLLVGLDIGTQSGIRKEIKKMGIAILIVPLMTAIGSIGGGMVAGFLLKMPVKESAAVGAGFGWYSFSAIALADYSTELGAIAFLSNVIRELLAILLIPFIALKIGYLEAIAPAGATAMDTTLPIISRNTESKIAIYAFISGCLLSMLVPVLVPLIISI